jgi:hypothetical protein
MFRKLFSRYFKKKRRPDIVEMKQKLTQALKPSGGLTVVYDELTEYEIKGVLFKLQDKVICRSNECGPLLVGCISSFWDNDGKWSNCIPQILCDNGSGIWGVMGHIKPYTEELMETLTPMRPLEQWNYLLSDDVKEQYSYTEDEMDKKEKQYQMVQKKKETMAN